MTGHVGMKSTVRVENKDIRGSSGPTKSWFAGFLDIAYAVVDAVTCIGDLFQSRTVYSRAEQRVYRPSAQIARCSAGGDLIALISGCTGEILAGVSIVE